MPSNQTVQEIEETLGQVPGFLELPVAPASDHSWAIFRDLVLGETHLSAREKALVGLAAAAVTKCPYCTYFHTEEARLADVTDDEIEETVNVAANTQYFSTILHGNEYDRDEFVAETDEIVAYIGEREEAAADD